MMIWVKHIYDIDMNGGMVRFLIDVVCHLGYYKIEFYDLLYFLAHPHNMFMWFNK